MTLTVLFGGQSNEYAVSLRSAAAVLRAARLPSSAVGITKDGRFLRYTGGIDSIERDTWQDSAVPISPTELSGSVVFPLLHGRHGEDGELQGLLSSLSIPYIGCRTFGGAVGMDKFTAKALAEKADVPTLLYALVYKSELSDPNLFSRIEKNIPYPLFVKPSDGGSSIGAGIARGAAELCLRLHAAAEWSERILVERYCPAREIELAVLEEHGRLTVSLPGEIVSNTDFYDYDTKYTNDTARLCVPANLSDETVGRLQEYARRLFLLFDCRHLARIDFFLSGGQIFFNEINTMPGFTSISMYPRLMEHSGIPLSELISRLYHAAFP